MCKAPKPPKPKDPEKPEFLRNPYLDAAVGQSGVVNALRSGRSGLRIRPGGDTPTSNTPPPTVGVAPPPRVGANTPPPGGDFRGIGGRRSGGRRNLR